MPRVESESVNVLVRCIHKVFNLFSVKRPPNMSKRKTDYPESTGDPVPKKDRHGNCMLHMNDSKMTQFTYFSELDKAEERFQKIIDIRVERLAHSAGSSHRMQLVCEQIPLNFTDKDGYHRDQRFTMIMNRLKPATQTGPQTETRPKRSRSSEGVIFDSDCTFCGNFSRKKCEKEE